MALAQVLFAHDYFSIAGVYCPVSYLTLAWNLKIRMKLVHLASLYGGQKGFEVRKRCTNIRSADGKVTSCRFVCARKWNA